MRATFGQIFAELREEETREKERLAEARMTPELLDRHATHPVYRRCHWSLQPRGDCRCSLCSGVLHQAGWPAGMRGDLAHVLAWLRGRLEVFVVLSAARRGLSTPRPEWMRIRLDEEVPG